MSPLHIFIISWAGQHENALLIAKNLLPIADRISIVYSDPDPHLILDVECNLIRRPNELFWGDKFKACLDANDSGLMLIIHADCNCKNWPLLVQKCQQAYEMYPTTIGVWAPLVDWTPYDINKTFLANIQSTSLRIVAQTDSIVFCLHQRVAERMKSANYENNTYGWGIDSMAIAFTFSNSMLAVVDTSISVEHPKFTGYPANIARGQWMEFLKQLLIGELIQHKLLMAHIRMNRIMGENRSSDK